MSEEKVSPEAAPVAGQNPEKKKEKKKESGFWSDVGKSFSGENLGEALAYFTPDIVGGMLGYALGGKRGALEGLQHANKLRLGVDEQRRKDREFNLKQAQILGVGKKSKMQQTEGKYFISPKGQKQYVYFDPKLGHVFRDESDKITKVPQGIKIEDPKDVRQIRGIGEKRKMKAATATEATKTLLSGLKGLEKYYPSLDKYAGKIQASVTSVKEFFGKNTPEGVALGVEIKDLTKMYVFALSGVAVRPEELEQAKKIVPQLNDHPATFEYKNKALKRIMEERIDLINKNYTNPEIARRLKKTFDEEVNYMKKKGMRLSTGVKSIKDYEKEDKKRIAKSMKTYGIE